jgi:uncharacterized membrane protein YgcG
MDIPRRTLRLSPPRSSAALLVALSTMVLLLAAWPHTLPAHQGAQPPAPSPPGPPYAAQTPQQLQQLVAPIALYPDSLVAQILAASTFPEQVVEADRWVQAHPDLKGDALAQAVDQQPWDPSVKALCAFPAVLGNMDKNLSWTSTLGDAYYNQEQDVMDAVQEMRRRAEDAGNLKSTPQEKVTSAGPDIEIAPADPEIVYVPAYNPWLVYGGPVIAWPGWYPYPGIWFDGPYLSFGVGFGIGFWGGWGWGWGHWGFDWHHRYAVYDHRRYYSGSRTFYNRDAYYRGGAARGGQRPGGDRFGGERGRPERGAAADRPGRSTEPFGGNKQAARGFTEPHGQTGTRTGAFSNYGHGGEERSYSSRGRASFGGGGSFHGGGGRH